MTGMVMKEQSSEFRKGLQAGLSIGIGYFPVALTFGLLAKTTGLTLTETVLMSLIIKEVNVNFVHIRLILKLS